MNNPNTIHIEMPGIEAKLDRIIELLETTHNCDQCAKTIAAYVANGCKDFPAEAVTADAPAAPAEEPKPEAVEPVTPAEETPAQTDETPAAPTVTVAEVQRKVVELSAAGKKEAAREIALAYGNKKVSDIPEDKLGEVMAKLNALEV